MSKNRRVPLGALSTAALALTVSFATPALAQLQKPGGAFVLDNEDLVVKDANYRTRMRVDATTGDIRIYDTNGDVIYYAEGASGANLWVGGHGQDGDLVIMPSGATSQNTNESTIHLNGQQASASFGGPGQAGALVVRDANGVQSIGLLGDTGEVVAGQTGLAGSVVVRDADGDINARLDGATGNLRLGASGEGGDLVMRDDSNVTTVNMSANGRTFDLGTASRPGYLTVAPSITMDGQAGDITIGNGSASGDLHLIGSGGSLELSLSAGQRSLAVGSSGAGTIVVRDGAGDDVIQFEGSQERIRVGGLSEHTEVHHDGIRFPDGTVQSTALTTGATGPQGPQGSQGPQGPPVNSSAICIDGDSAGSAPGCNAVCSGTFAQATSPCRVTSDNGSCSAGTYWNGAFKHAGRCCVCN